MAKENKQYDEDYLNGLIAKAKKSWEGVDVDSYMNNLRDDSFDKEVAEKEQKDIDDAEWLKIKSSWEREAQINHNDEANYQQGFHDAIEKACNIFCHTGCPHKTDSYNCLNDKCDTWKIFRRMMEE